MASDYTPGHALRDLDGIDIWRERSAATMILTKLYRAGQANERAAVIAALEAAGAAIAERSVGVGNTVNYDYTVSHDYARGMMKAAEMIVARLRGENADRAE